jgi:ABC-type transport system involved in multi-copper enzyme maturation permease subunit
MTIAVARQMLSAEILKLRRNRALMAFAFVLTVVVMMLVFGYPAAQHASDPTQNAPAGGVLGFSRAVRVLGLFFGALTAMLIGTEAGTADVSSGVFRDLVATGRSRLALFFVRAPAAIIVTLALSAVAFLITLAGTFLFADGLPTPSVSTIIQSAGWITLGNVIVASLAVGVGSLTGSRGVTLTAVIGWQTIATQILLNVTSLGSARDGLLTASLTQLMPVRGGLVIPMATGVALAVLAGWLVIPAAVGAWRTATQDA